jgi:hypothetical protein
LAIAMCQRQGILGDVLPRLGSHDGGIIVRERTPETMETIPVWHVILDLQRR